MFVAILKRFKSLIAYCLLSLFSIACIIFSTSNFSLNIKNIYMFTIYPLQNAGSNISRSLGRIYENINDIGRLQEELNVSRSRLAELENTMVSIEEVQRDNERLRRILGERFEMENTEYAQVVSKDPQNFFMTIVVDKGSANGIKVGMPVIGYSKGLKAVVGKIIEVTPNYSKVLPLTDQNSQIGAMLDISRNAGILKGQSIRSTLCYLQFIDKSVQVEEGEVVVTSGMGGVFPKGYLIGRVFNIEKKNYGLFHDIYVEPTINLSSLEEVYIIKRNVDAEVLSLTSEDMYMGFEKVCFLI